VKDPEGIKCKIASLNFEALQGAAKVLELGPGESGCTGCYSRRLAWQDILVGRSPEGRHLTYRAPRHKAFSSY
jgi:hypothetical protein